MPSKIVRRILAGSEVPRLFDLLAEEMPPTDLQSLLLEAFRRRAAVQTPASLIARARRGGIVAASDVDARLLNRVESCAFEAAEGFEAVELAPALPLGTQAVLGGIDQNNILTTIRNSEAPGDPTQGLAIQAALRRAQSSANSAAVRLCAAQRVVRLQPFDVPGFSPHFKLFCLTSAGRDTGRLSFETGQLREHIRIYLRFFRLLNNLGFGLREPLVEVSDPHLTATLLGRAGITTETVREKIRAHRLGGAERLFSEFGLPPAAHCEHPAAEFGQHGEALQRVEEAVFSPLRREFPEASFRLLIARLEGFGYYSGLCLRISPLAADGSRYPIGDGGFVDWTARLLENRKERLLASGIGIEFICRRYR